MAPARHDIHIVQDPDDTGAPGERAEERVIIDKAGDPMQVDHITGRELFHKIECMHTAVIAKWFQTCGSGGVIAREISKNLSPSQITLHASGNIH